MKAHSHDMYITRARLGVWEIENLSQTPNMHSFWRAVYGVDAVFSSRRVPRELTPLELARSWVKETEDKLGIDLWDMCTQGKNS